MMNLINALAALKPFNTDGRAVVLPFINLLTQPCIIHSSTDQQISLTIHTSMIVHPLQASSIQPGLNAGLFLI